jgi:hypothetical protein
MERQEARRESEAAERMVYVPPKVVDLGRLEDVTAGVKGGPTEASSMKT